MIYTWSFIKRHLRQKIGVRTMRVRFFGESIQNEISRSTSLDRQTGCMVTFRVCLSFFQIMQPQWTMYSLLSRYRKDRRVVMY